MPNCFQLFRKSDTNQTTPLKLNVVDEEICNAFNIPVHSIFYGGGSINWFDTIGYMIATGCGELGEQSLKDKLTEWKMNERYHKVLQFMEENYTSTSFYEHGR